MVLAYISPKLNIAMILKEYMTFTSPYRVLQSDALVMSHVKKPRVPLWR